MKQMIHFLLILLPFCLSGQIQGNDRSTITKDEDSPLQKIPEGAILFNEIMANPKGLTQLPATEYIEIINTTDECYDLTNCLFIYGKTTVVLPAAELPGHTYAVLFREGREINTGQGLSLGLARFPAALANTGKKIQLINCYGEIIDSYTYPKAVPAKSWERSDNGWHLSTDHKGGTPGGVNSDSEQTSEDEEGTDHPEEPDHPEEEDGPIEAREIIFNEILPDPYTNGSEYIEFYNRSSRTLSLASLALSIRRNDGKLSTCYPLPPIIMKPEEYAVVTKDPTGVLPFYTIMDESVIHAVERLPVLANNSSDLVLYRIKDLVPIDEVHYSDDWHSPGIRQVKGVALERISPDSPTQDPNNWTSAASTAGFGTPGYRNSQREKEGEADIFGIEPPLWEGGDNYKICYRLEENGYQCRISIYSTSGQKVCEIGNNSSLATEGYIRWDGTDTKGQRLLPGMYIFYAELYHPTEGKSKRQKKVFLIH